MFGKNVLTNKYTNTPEDDAHAKFKSLIESIASEEMKNMSKVSPGEYRTRFTNAFFNKKSDIGLLTQEGLTQKLNNILSVFSSNVFIGYNVPIEIPIQGTEIMYRYILDFLLVDSEERVVAVEIEDFKNIDLAKRKMKHWPHYYTPYSFLTDVFKKDIYLQFIDPNLFVKTEYRFTGSSLSDDLVELKSVVSAVTNAFYVKNLTQCTGCQYVGSCD